MAVDFFLQTNGEKVRLRLVHSGFGEGDQWDEQYDGTEAGWLFFLFNLQHYLKYHSGLRRYMISARERLRGSRREIWARILHSGAGLIKYAPDLIEIGSSLELGIGEEAAVEAILEVLVEERTLGLRIAELNNAVLHIEVEPGAKNCSVGFWLSTYGLEKPEPVRQRFARAVEALCNLES